MKVLDFGLAKGLDVPSSAGVDVMSSPTLSAHATETGLILGTAAYMSPEQARGKAVDRRADLWAFGCVLYEMLTRQRAFGGDSSDRCAGGRRDDRAGLDEAAGRDPRSDSHVAPAVPGKESRAPARFRHGCTVGDRRRAGDSGCPDGRGL